MFSSIPITCFSILLIVAVMRQRKTLLSPPLVLVSPYLLISVAAVFADEDWFRGQASTASLATIIGFTALICVALLPSFALKIPAIPLVINHNWITRSIGASGIILAYYSVAYLTPVLIRSLAVDAHEYRYLRQAEVFSASPALTLAIIAPSFSAIYGLFLFRGSQIGRSTVVSRLIFVGLVLGYISFGILSVCHKGRDGLLFYTYTPIFYYIMFARFWTRSFARRFNIITGVIGVALALSFAITTWERFVVTGNDTTLKGGTLGYFSQQLHIFSDITSTPGNQQHFRELSFPIYNFLTSGEWPDTSKILDARQEAFESSFGTFLGSLYFAFGWQGTIIFVVAFSGLFLCVFESRLHGNIGYLIAGMVYYQILFEGVLYWTKFGRSGNIYLIGALVLAVVFGIASVPPARGCITRGITIRPVSPKQKPFESASLRPPIT